MRLPSGMWLWFCLASVTQAGPASRCPWHQPCMGDVCYKFVRLRNSFWGAQAWCQANGGRLAHPWNPETQALLSHCLAEGEKWWVGLREHPGEKNPGGGEGSWDLLPLSVLGGGLCRGSFSASLTPLPCCSTRLAGPSAAPIPLSALNEAPSAAADLELSSLPSLPRVPPQGQSLRPLPGREQGAPGASFDHTLASSQAMEETMRQFNQAIRTLHHLPALQRACHTLQRLTQATSLLSEAAQVAGGRAGQLEGKSRDRWQGCQEGVGCHAVPAAPGDCLTGSRALGALLPWGSSRSPLSHWACGDAPCLLQLTEALENTMAALTAIQTVLWKGSCSVESSVTVTSPVASTMLSSRNASTLPRSSYHLAQPVPLTLAFPSASAWGVLLSKHPRVQVRVTVLAVNPFKHLDGKEIKSVGNIFLTANKESIEVQDLPEDIEIRLWRDKRAETSPTGLNISTEKFVIEVNVTSMEDTLIVRVLPDVPLPIELYLGYQHPPNSTHALLNTTLPTGHGQHPGKAPSSPPLPLPPIRPGAGPRCSRPPPGPGLSAQHPGRVGREERRAGQSRTGPGQGGYGGAPGRELCAVPCMARRSPLWLQVVLTLYGTEGRSEPHCLRDPHKPVFERGGLDVFLVTTRSSLGELHNIRLWHDNSGSSPSWYVRQVVVSDVTARRKWHFLCSAWLAADLGDCQLDQVFPAASRSELLSSRHLFCSALVEKVTHDHLWLSVLSHCPWDPFTRLQRLACCLTLLLCTMVINIMFWRDLPEVRAWGVALRELVTSVQTALILLPINLVIGHIFQLVPPQELPLPPTGVRLPRASAPRRGPSPLTRITQVSPLAGREPASPGCSGAQRPGAGWNPAPPRIVAMSPRTPGGSRVRGRLCTGNCMACDGGLAWGDRTNAATPALSDSHHHLSSHLSHVLGPLQAQLRALDLSQLCNPHDYLQAAGRLQSLLEQLEQPGPCRQERDSRLTAVFICWVTVAAASLASAYFTVLLSLKLDRQRATSWVVSMLLSLLQNIFIMQPLKVKSSVREPRRELGESHGTATGRHNHALTCLSAARCPYLELPGTRDWNDPVYHPPCPRPASPRRGRTWKKKKLYTQLGEIVAQLVLLASLMVVCYTERSPHELYFNEAIRKGITPNFYHIRGLGDFYRWARGTLLPSLDGPRPGECPHPLPMPQGPRGGRRHGQSGERLAPRDSRTWCGRPAPAGAVLPHGPRAGPSSLCPGSRLGAGLLQGTQGKAVSSRAKRSPLPLPSSLSGAFLPSAELQSIRLHSSSGLTQLTCAQVTYLLLQLFDLWVQGRRLKQQKWRYFSSQRNVLDMSIILISLAAFGVSIKCRLLQKSVMEKYHRDRSRFVSFYETAQVASALTYLLAFLVTLATGKLWNLLRLSPRMHLISGTLRRAWQEVLGFLLVLLLLLVGYSMACNLLFGWSIANYKTFFSSSVTIVGLLIGIFNYDTVINLDPVLGSLLITTSVISMLYVVINLFVSGLLTTFSEERASANKDESLMDGILLKLSGLFGIKQQALERTRLAGAAEKAGPV
uniref:PLAT domain-containing protein n=1 Tax=Terrapene triunguis TaxID=2587831 RepID=A0A674K207_9SAUR